MDELVFVVEQSPVGGLRARAVGVDITVAARDDADLREKIEQAVSEYFEEDQAPSRIRLHRRQAPA